MPPFFYLANCHGNDPAAIEKGRAAVESLAARLHREGVAQVVAYSGPILDVLSTEAEAALYAAIADGHTTRFAVRQAREALSRPIGPSRSVLREVDPRVVDVDARIVPVRLVATGALSPRARPSLEPARAVGRHDRPSGTHVLHRTYPRCRHPAHPGHRLHRAAD